MDVSDRRFLAIFESSAKAMRMQSLLDEVEYGVWRCIYSTGHITELDVSDFWDRSDESWSRTAIELARGGERQFELRRSFHNGHEICRARTKRVWRDVTLTDRILKSMKRHELIVVASDPDREGESIASDLFALSKPLGIPTRRVRMKEMNADAFLQSLDKDEPLNENLVRAARLRAAGDLWIGLGISKFVGLHVGRVRTPLVSELQKYLSDKDLEIPTAGRNAHVLPMTTWDLCRSFPNVLPSAVMERAQSLYVDGYLSYPRTDSVRLSEDSMKRLWGLTSAGRRARLAGMLDEADAFAHSANGELFNQVQGENVQDAHEALHLLRSYDGSDGMESAICRRVEEATTGFIKGDVLFEKRKRERTRTADYGTLVELMQENGIGRPSTIGRTVDAPLGDGQIVLGQGGRGANVALCVSDKGLEMLERVELVCPELADPEYTARMERRLDRIAQGDRGEQNAFLLDAVHLTEKAASNAHKLEFKEREKFERNAELVYDCFS